MQNKISSLSGSPRFVYQFRVGFICDTPGATIRCEVGEASYPPKDPDENSKTPNQIESELAEGTIIKARAFKNGLEPSEIAIEEIPYSSTLNETQKLLKPVLSKHDDGSVYIKNIAYYSMYSNTGGITFIGDSDYSSVEDDSASIQIDYESLYEGSEIFEVDSFPFYIKAADFSGDHESSDIVEII